MLFSFFRNKSVESLQLNTQKWKEYKSKSILFPQNSKKPRKDDATAKELPTPVKPAVKRVPAMEGSDDLKKFQAFPHYGDHPKGKHHGLK